MTNISERLVVHCPDREASHHLASFIADHCAKDGSIRITLRLPVTIFADRRTVLERSVVATLFPLRSIHDAHPTYSVTWSPKAGAYLPDFTGALAVEKSVRDDCFGLVLSGHYQPPFGVVGSLFDAALGHRIAHLSARDLLHTIASHVEYSCARSEADRAGHYRLASVRSSAGPQLAESTPERRSP